MNVAAAILVYNNKIIAFQRPLSVNKDISLKYEFPGGKVKKNETPVVALVRELKEELNLNVHNLQNYFESTYKYPDLEVNLNFFITEIKNLNFKLNVHLSYKIIDIKELKKLDWLAADYSVIDFIESNGVAKYLD